jgi:tripartite-type tricarboxylate transporter receptor subunit TctC
MRRICRVPQAFRMVAVMCAVAAIVGGATLVGAADLAFPKRAVDAVVPISAGGATDTWARTILPYLSKKWGVPINVVNKPGGSGVIGTVAVLSSAPDGYSVVVDGHIIPAVTAVQADCPFKWSDPTPIAKMVSGPLAFAVPADSPWRTLKEALEAIRKDPESIKAGVGGVSMPAVFALAKLFDSLGIDFKRMSRVIFDGSAPTMAALAGKHVMLTSQPLIDAVAMLKGGKIRVLAISAPRRSPNLPDIPTGAELGYPAYDRQTFGGIAGPANLPPAIVKIFADGLQEALQDRAIIERLESRETMVDFQGPEEYRKFLETQYRENLAIAERLGLRK